MGQCTYCGFCEWFGCANYSKASPQTTILPVLLRKSNFAFRDNSEVVRINVDRSGHRATGVTFVDTENQEWEQPADLVILSAYTMFNVQLLLLSGIGEAYDPAANKGVVGRNFTHQTMSSVDGFFDKAKFNFNPFIASGAIGMCIDEFNGDNFDHGPHGFVGGGYLGQVQTNGRPIETTPVPSGTPKWGAKWKEAVRDNYLSSLKGGSIHASFYSYRDVYLDLDPAYKDRFGRPLMRMTIDFHDNELKAAAFLTDKYAEIVKAMGAKQVDKSARKGPYDITKYQTTRHVEEALLLREKAGQLVDLAALAQHHALDGLRQGAGEVDLPFRPGRGEAAAHLARRLRSGARRRFRLAARPCPPPGRPGQSQS